MQKNIKKLKTIVLSNIRIVNMCIINVCSYVASVESSWYICTNYCKVKMQFRILLALKFITL